MKFDMLGARIPGLVLGIFLLSGLSVAAYETDKLYRFDVPKQAAGAALNTFAQQAEQQVLFPFNRVKSITTNTLKGEYTITEGIQNLLKGTGLKPVFSNDGVITIESDADNKIALEGKAAMKKDKPKSSIFSKVVLLLIGAASMQGVSAQETETDASASILEEIVTIGSRREGRSSFENIVPVDIFDEEILQSSGYSDLADSLRYLIPSFNVKRHPANDGAIFVRPASLRGAPPDHILVLMNGKRRHRSAYVNIGSGINADASQGVDFSVLPSIAFRDVQVLRDGAAAQYGSDAIAGVMNISLKEESEGGSVIVSFGQYFEGDGDNIDIQGNIGLPLTENGFINISGQILNSNPTDRAVQRPDAIDLVARGFQGVPDPAQNWGDPDVRAYRIVWNGGLMLSDTMEAYFFGNYAKSEQDGSFFYRNPEVTSPFTADPNAAVGRVPNPSDFSQFDESPEHPGIFDLRDVYPGGFTPRFGADKEDFSQVSGVKGELSNGLSWDTSFRFGLSEIDYNIKNTINPSLGDQSPRDFKPGALQEREVQFNLDLVYDLQNDMFASDLTIAGGFEWKEDTYTITVGDEASFTTGPLLDMPAGSNGFPGFSPVQAGEFSRSNYSLYLDLETDITDSWTVGLAGRFEDYTDFGTTVNGKAATRFEITDNFAIRGTVSTGFRAPTVGQLFSSTIQTAFSNDPIPVPIVRGTFRADSAEAQFFGAEELKPEESTNYSAGFVFSTDSGFVTTVDIYQIDVDDRMLFVGPFTVTNADRAGLAAAGVANAAFLGQVTFLKNVFETRTRGVDIVSAYTHGWNSGNATDFSVGFNYNDISLEKLNPGDFSTSASINFEGMIPSSKGNITVVHHANKFDFMARGNYYGKWTRGFDDGSRLERNPTMLLDLELTYHVTDNIDIKLGGRNLLDKTPPSKGWESFGMRFDDESPYGFNGGYYYTTITYHF